MILGVKVMADNKKVMVAGHICLDITPAFTGDKANLISDVLCPGKLVNVGDAVLSTGGAVSNTGLSMSRIGVDVMLNAKIGDDGFGGIIRSLVGSEKSGAFKVVAGQSSSYSVVIAIPGIDRIFLHNPGTNDTFTSDDIDYAAAAKCDLFHFGYPSLMRQMYSNGGRELVEIFRRVKQSGVITSLDMTLPDPQSDSGRVNWREIFVKTLPFVDVFMPSVEEIAFMIDRDLFTKNKNLGKSDPVLGYNADDCERLAVALIDMGVKIAAVKCGINGLYLRTASAEKLAALSGNIDVSLWADRQMWMPSFKADAVASSTGAGDATIGGFLAALVRGRPPRQCLAIANAMGFQNVATFDALSGIGDWDTTLKIATGAGRRQNMLEVEQPGWQYCADNRVYYGPIDSRKE